MAPGPAHVEASHTARFLFTLTGRTDDGSHRRGAWPGVDLPAPAPLICWRLLAPDDRQLGRSPGRFKDVEGCLASVDALLAGFDELQPRSLRLACPVRWWWEIFSSDTSDPVAISARTLEKERQACRTLETFFAVARKGAGDADRDAAAVAAPSPRGRAGRSDLTRQTRVAARSRTNLGRRCPVGKSSAAVHRVVVLRYRRCVKVAP
jgi:hypothetical protein